MAFEPEVQNVLDKVFQIVRDPRTKDPNAAFGAIDRLFPAGNPQLASTSEDIAAHVQAQRLRDIALSANKVMTGDGTLDTSSRFYKNFQAAITGETAPGFPTPHWKAMERQFGHVLAEAAEGTFNKIARKAGPVGIGLGAAVVFTTNAFAEGTVNTEVLDKTATQALPGYEAAKEGDWCRTAAEWAGVGAGLVAGGLVGAATSLAATPVAGVPAGIATDVAVNYGVTEGLSWMCPKPSTTPTPKPSP